MQNLSRENARATCKNMEREKKHDSKFLALSINDIKTKKKQK